MFKRKKTTAAQVLLNIGIIYRKSRHADQRQNHVYLKLGHDEIGTKGAGDGEKLY